MEGLVLRSLAKIRKLVGGSSRKHKALRDACDTVMGKSRYGMVARHADRIEHRGLGLWVDRSNGAKGID